MDDSAVEEKFCDFNCPKCGEQISFPELFRGTAQECFACGTTIIAPLSGDQGGLVPLPVNAERLVLRKFRGADWKRLLELFADDEFFSAAPFKLEGEEAVTRWLDEDANVKLTTPNAPFVLALELRDPAKVIGCVSLRFSDADHLQAVMQIALHREFHRQGYGAEAARALLGFCFQGVSLHRVQSFCESTNTAGRRLLEKIGMRREAEFISDHRVLDQWANTTVYGILREEFSPLP